MNSRPTGTIYYRNTVESRKSSSKIAKHAPKNQGENKGSELMYLANLKDDASQSSVSKMSSRNSAYIQSKFDQIALAQERAALNQNSSIGTRAKSKQALKGSKATDTSFTDKASARSLRGPDSPWDLDARQNGKFLNGERKGPNQNFYWLRFQGIIKTKKGGFNNNL